MNLIDAESLAKNLMNENKLYGWRFSFDNSVRRFGVCRHSLRKISLSKTLVELNSEEVVKDTILHEVAHALAGRQAGHGYVWRHIALSIGCDGNRCYDSTTVITPKKKYIGECPNGHITQKHRQLRLSCSKCCPRFNEAYLFTYRPNA